MKKQTSFSDKVIQQLNSVRLFPKNYSKTIRNYINFFKGNVLKYPGVSPIPITEGPKAFEEAALFLEQQKNLPKTAMLVYNKDLESICKDILQDISEIDDIKLLEEYNFQEKIEKYGNIKGADFRFLDFETDLPEILVTNIIVDDGNKSRSNRKNIFNEKLKFVGVCKLEHKCYNNSGFVIMAEDFINISEVNKEEITTTISKGLNIIRKCCLTPEIRKNIKELIEAMKKVEIMEEVFGSKDKENLDIYNKYKQENRTEEEDSNENVVKMTRSEQIIKIEDKDIKVVVINKVYRDGTVSTEKTKEFLSKNN